MNWIIAMVSGLVLGWLAEWLIDASFWRRRRICTENETVLETSIAQLRGENESLLSQIQNFTKQATQTQTSQNTNYETLLTDYNRQSGELASLRSELTELHTCKAQVSSLTAELKMASSRIGELDGQISEQQTVRARLEAQLAQLRKQASDDTSYETLLTDYNRQSTEVTTLRSQLTDLHTCKAQVSSLTAELDASNSRIGRLDVQLSEQQTIRTRLEAQLAEMTKPAELQQQGGDDTNYETLMTEFNIQGSELTALRSQLTELHTYKAQVSSLTAELNASNERIGQLGVQIGEHHTVRAGLEAQLAELQAYKGQIATLTSETTSSKARIQELRRELNKCQTVRTGVESQLADLRTRHATNVAQGVQAQNLGMIWGITKPVNNELLVQGIITYHQLAEAKLRDVETAVSLAARHYHNMSHTAIHRSWVEQANIASIGQWDQLAEWQGEKFDVRSGRDDLQLLWGIGPKIEGILNDHGIYLWSQIAAIPAERLTEILREAGERYRLSSDKLHTTWPKQAQLADLGRMTELKKLKAGLTWSKVNKGS